MSIEQIINRKLNNFPNLKKHVKKIYQRSMYLLSKKIISEGKIQKISPSDDNLEYFFGYYDKTPWSKDGRLVLCLRVENTLKDPSPKEKADIIVIDTLNGNKVTKIGETVSWNVQQGCMLQWLNGNGNRIIYNNFIDGKYCSVIKEINILDNNITIIKEKIIDMPIYSVSHSGKFALTLDFSRLFNLRPGYGYRNLPEKTKDIAVPKTGCIYKIDLETNESTEILTYNDLYNFEFREEMKNAIHKVNHIMISPNDDKFMVLHRWLVDDKKFTRLITSDIDGEHLFNLSDDDMVSHCFWLNNNEIIAFENKHETGQGYYIMRDRTNEYYRILEEIDFDGHPSYSNLNGKIVFDRYPDRARVASIMIYDFLKNDKKSYETVAKVFSPFKYDGDVRCDLHPRWDRKGEKICFDSVHEGKRGLYIVEL